MLHLAGYPDAPKGKPRIEGKIRLLQNLLLRTSNVSRSSEADVTLAGTAWASLGVVTYPEHKIFHPLNERMFLFNLIGSVVEPHVIDRTLAPSCNDFHDVLSEGLAGGISRIA
jgi:hypothetical protein